MKSKLKFTGKRLDRSTLRVLKKIQELGIKKGKTYFVRGNQYESIFGTVDAEYM